MPPPLAPLTPFSLLSFMAKKIKIYTDKDADFRHLRRKTIAVIGYGSQGHAHAQNLRDSGCKVIVGLYPESGSRRIAKRDGLSVCTNAEAVQQADVIMLAVPDMKQPEVYEKDVKPHLTPEKTLVFSHGFCIHYKFIEPPADVDVIMVAPKGPGHVVRSQFLEEKGVPALIAATESSSDDAIKIALAWAKGIGGTRAGVLQTTFKEETETDLFGEQAVLCGGTSALVKMGFETLVKAGYQPEMAYFECLHELKLIVDLMIESGISGMRFSVSETAKYGDITRGPKIIDEQARKKMEQILNQIQSGEFAKEWRKEYKNGLPNYKKLLHEGETHLIEDTGKRLRSIMPWIKKRNIKGAQAAYN